MRPERACRVCLSESNELKPLRAQFHSENKTILETINSVVNLNIQLEKGLPDKICKDCECNLNVADDFKKLCSKSETVLGCYINVIIKKEDSFVEVPETFQKKVTVYLPSIEPSVVFDQEKNNENKLQKEENTMTPADTANTTNIIVKIEPIYDKETSSSFNDTEISTEQQRSLKEGCDDTKTSKKESLTVTDNKPCSNKEISENKEILACPHCERTFQNKLSYKTHLFRKHDPKNLGKFECSVCQKTFSIRYNFKVHLRTHKPKVKKINTDVFLCDYCNRQFGFKSNLTKHIKTVHHGRHTCKECGSIFPEKEILEAHKLEHRKDRNTQVCPICGAKLKANYHNLLAHMKRHQNIKEFKCDQCDKSFVTKQEVKVHMQVHTGARPFPCDECGRYFASKGCVRLHRESAHSSARPHACEQCFKTFQTAFLLTRHRATHSAVKHECSHCAASYVRSDKLRRHIRNKHADKWTE